MHLLAVAPQSLRDRLVVRQQPVARVDDEQHDVGFCDRELRLVRRGAEQWVVGAQQQAARVDQLERTALPLDLRVVAVARGAGPAVGDRLAGVRRCG